METLKVHDTHQVTGGLGPKTPWTALSPGAPDESFYELLPGPEIPDNPLQPPPPPVDPRR